MAMLRCLISISLLIKVCYAEEDDAATNLRGSSYSTAGIGVPKIEVVELAARHLDNSVTEASVGFAQQECTGEADLPQSSSPICYQGSLLVETLGVKIFDYSKGSGSVDILAKGPKAGSCSKAAFTKTGLVLSIADAASCGLGDSEFTVNYCPDQDLMMLNIVKPLPLSVALKRVECSSSVFSVPPSLLIAAPPSSAPSPPPQMRSEPAKESQPTDPVAVKAGDDESQPTDPEDLCEGDANIPAELPLCYSGALLIQKLKVKVLNYQDGQGAVNIVAEGPKSGECNVDFKKEGQALSLLDPEKCGFQGAEFTLRYCSKSDKVLLQLVKPFELDLALQRNTEECQA